MERHYNVSFLDLLPVRTFAALLRLFRGLHVAFVAAMVQDKFRGLDDQNQDTDMSMEQCLRVPGVLALYPPRTPPHSPLTAVDKPNLNHHVFMRVKENVGSYEIQLE